MLSWQDAHAQTETIESYVLLKTVLSQVEKHLTIAYGLLYKNFHKNW